VLTQDGKLRELIEKKSSLLTEFSSKMESWIEGLTVKKEFLNNLRHYILREKGVINHAIKSFAAVLAPSHLAVPPSQLLLLNQHLQLLGRCLQSFIDSIIKAYDFS
jgi:hypothetical protein